MKNQVVFLTWIDEREPPRTRLFVVVSLALLALCGTGVQSAPLEKPRAVGCPPYTHRDSSNSRCVDCTGEQFKCHAGWELKEDCGYSPEGYHVADACRQCPNGTYSEGTYLTGAGQNHGQCQDCKTCPSGYERECNPKQQTVCQEMLVCCLCLYDDPNPQDVIYECQLQYQGTRYHCKDSISTGYTCTRPPQATTTVVPHHVSSPIPPQTTVNASQIVPTPDTTNSSKAPPSSPTSTTSSEFETPTTSHPTGISSTTDKNGMVTPALKGKSQLPWFLFVVIAACVLIGSAITCYCYREKIAACILKPKDVKFNRLEEAVSEDEGEQQKGELAENTKHAGQGKEVDNSDGADSGNVSQESSVAGSDKRDSQCSSEDSLLDAEGGQEEEREERERSDSEEGDTLDNEDETSPKVGAGPEETMRFARRIEGPPNEEKSLKAVPFEGGVDLRGGSRSPRDNTADPAISGAQGFSNPSVPIQVPDFIGRMPLEAILNEEDLFYHLRIKLEQSDKPFRNIGSHFGLTHEELNFIEFTELRGKDSPLKAILEKVIQLNESVTVGELLQYCHDKLKRRDVVKMIVEYFVEKEQDNQKMEVKEDVTSAVSDSQSQQPEESSKDNDIELKKLVLQSTGTDDVSEGSMSEQSAEQDKLGTCDVDAIELVEMQC